MKPVLLASLVILLSATGALAQRGRGAAPAPAAKARTVPVRVTVRDQSGNNVDGARVTLSGDSSGDFTTAAAGLAILPNLKDGAYRVHVQHEGFTAADRDFTVKAGAPSTIEIVLTALPPAPPPPPPPAPPARVSPPAGPPISVSIVDYLDKNYIGRDPLRESVLACTPLETVRLLQMRDAVAPHAHADTDEVVYVVAGEGAVRFGEDVVPLKAGSMVVVPRATTHAFERRGKNPLVVLSTLSGAACHEAVESR